MEFHQTEDRQGSFLRREMYKTAPGLFPVLSENGNEKKSFCSSLWTGKGLAVFCVFTGSYVITDYNQQSEWF